MSEPPRYDVSVVTSGHDVADARLHRVVAALQRCGLSVQVLGLGSAADAPRGCAARAWPRPGLVGRARLAAVLPWRAAGRVLLCLDPETVPAAMLRRVAGTRVVVDVHEDYRDLLRDRAWARGLVGVAGRAVVAVSTSLAAAADLTVVADDHLLPLAARRRMVVRNVPEMSMLPPAGDRDPTPRAVYVGDMRRSRGLFTMLSALEQAPGWVLDLVGPVAEIDRPALDRWLRSAPAAERVRLHGRLGPQESWRVASGAWAGLALLDSTPAFRAAVPTKLYEYLACGLAVLTTPLPRMQQIVDASGAGATAASAQEAAAVLRSWSARPASIEALAARALSWSACNAPATSPYDLLAAEVATLVRRSAQPAAG